MALSEQDALYMPNVALRSMRSLWDLTNLPYDWEDPEMKEVQRAIAKVMGSIDLDFLKVLYKKYPHINDLKNYMVPIESDPTEIKYETGPA